MKTKFMSLAELNRLGYTLKNTAEKDKIEYYLKTRTELVLDSKGGFIATIDGVFLAETKNIEGSSELK